MTPIRNQPHVDDDDYESKSKGERETLAQNKPETTSIMAAMLTTLLTGLITSGAARKLLEKREGDESLRSFKAN